MDLLPRDLVIRACVDLKARHDNGGSWPDGRPTESILEVAKLLQIDCQIQAITIAEHAVRTYATYLVAKELATEIGRTPATSGVSSTT